MRRSERPPRNPQHHRAPRNRATTPDHEPTRHQDLEPRHRKDLNTMATNGTTNGNGLRKNITAASRAANTAKMLTLESQATEQTGRAGLQYRYVLSGGKIMWAEPG